MTLRRAAPPLLALLLLLAQAARADDLQDLAAALAGSGVTARISVRLDPAGGAAGSFSATVAGAPGEALRRLVEKANAHLKKQADRLAGLGVSVGNLSLSEREADAIVRTTASCSDLTRVPAALSPKDPVDFAATREKGTLAVRVAPRPLLFLLAPFVAGFTVEAALPEDPAAHNATETKGRILRWKSARAFPTVEFALPSR